MSINNQTVEQFGHNQDDLHGHYYKMTEENRIPQTIEKSEFDEVFNSKYLSWEDCGEHTKNNTGMQFVPIFTD